MENLFGSELQVDPQILNKLRFALPTVGIAKAFNPSATDLPDKQYRDYKVNMLRWSFCRGLIISPPSLLNKLNGSAAQAEIFLHAVAPIKHLCVSCKFAAEELRPYHEEDKESQLNETRRPIVDSSCGQKTRWKKIQVRCYGRSDEQMFNIILEKIDRLKENRGVGEEEGSSKEEESLENNHKSAMEINQ